MRFCRSWLPVTLAASLGSGCALLEDLWKEHHGHHGGHGPDTPPCEPECDAKTQFATPSGACIRKAKQISVGAHYTCARLVGGGVKCWGRNDFRVLGYGDGGARGDEPGELGNALPFVDLGTGRTAVDVFAGNDLTCAELDNGSVKCWGYDGYGSVTSMPNSWDGQMGDALPTAPLPAGTVIALGSAAGYGFALLADGGLRLWGTSAGIATFAAGSSLVDFERALTYDGQHLCGLRDDGAVVCAASFGAPVFGQLGWPPEPSPPVGGYPPVELGTDRTATAIALGVHHTCALLDDQTVKCWGRNQYGQLGQGDTNSRGLLSTEMGDALPPIALEPSAIAIAAGNYHSCALFEGGDVKCWGFNDQGQLGQGDALNRGVSAGQIAALAPIPLGEPAVAIDAGSHSCALLASGAVKCWGLNDHGELGLGDTLSRGDQPGEVAALSPIDLGE